MNKVIFVVTLLAVVSGAQAGKGGEFDYIPQLDDKAAQWTQQHGYDSDAVVVTQRSVSPSENLSRNYEKQRVKAATIAKKQKRDERRKEKGSMPLTPTKRK